MSAGERLEKIEAKLTFVDGETVDVLIAIDADSAWGNVEKVLWRSVPIRESIIRTLAEDGLLYEADENEEEE